MMMQENNSLKLRIYSFNQKGRSPSYPLHDFIIGSTMYRTDDDVSLTLSPVIVGSVLTILIISLAIAVRIFMVTFLHNLRRNRQQGTKATAAGVVTQQNDAIFKNANMDKPRWQHTDIKTKSSEELVEDERDPDVIPSQYVGSGCSSSNGGPGSGNSGGSSVGGSGIGIGVGVNVNGCGISGSNGSNANNGNDHHFGQTTAVTSQPGAVQAVGGVTGVAASKWSPNSNHHSVPNYDTILQQHANNANASITYSEINARTHLMTTNSSMLSPTASTTGGIGLHHPQGVTGVIIGSPTSSSSTATIAAATHLQQQLHASGIGIAGGGTLPPGLGTGGGYILNSIINNSNSNVANAVGLHHSVAASSGSMGRATLHHPHHHQSHHNTLGSTNSRNHHLPSTAMLLASSQPTYSGCGSTPGSGSGLGLFMGGSGSGSVVGSSSGGIPLNSAASTATTSCNSSTDLDDNININAIKDCLMTQRVPESCV